MIFLSALSIILYFEKFSLKTVPTKVLALLKVIPYIHGQIVEYKKENILKNPLIWFKVNPDKKKMLCWPHFPGWHCCCTAIQKKKNSQPGKKKKTVVSAHLQSSSPREPLLCASHSSYLPGSSLHLARGVNVPVEAHGANQCLLQRWTVLPFGYVPSKAYSRKLLLSAD